MVQCYYDNVELLSYVHSNGLKAIDKRKQWTAIQLTGRCLFDYKKRFPQIPWKTPYIRSVLEDLTGQKKTLLSCLKGSPIEGLLQNRKICRTEKRNLQGLQKIIDKPRDQNIICWWRGNKWISQFKI